MSSIALLYPTLGLVALTLTVSFALVFYRFYLVRSGRVAATYFKFNRGAKMPALHDALSDNYTNLFQVPVLYYAVVVLAIATGQVDDTLVNLAWAFLLFRILHTAIHISYNHVLHRLFAFFVSYMIAIAMWLRVANELLAVK